MNVKAAIFVKARAETLRAATRAGVHVVHVSMPTDTRAQVRHDVTSSFKAHLYHDHTYKCNGFSSLMQKYFAVSNCLLLKRLCF